ncbi:MAG: hypothetical protein AAGN82_06995 [Myxococcota bacterium]
MAEFGEPTPLTNPTAGAAEALPTVAEKKAEGAARHADEVLRWADFPGPERAAFTSSISERALVWVFAPTQDGKGRTSPWSSPPRGAIHLTRAERAEAASILVAGVGGVTVAIPAALVAAADPSDGADLAPGTPVLFSMAGPGSLEGTSRYGRVADGEMVTVNELEPAFSEDEEPGVVSQFVERAWLRVLDGKLALGAPVVYTAEGATGCGVYVAPGPTSGQRWVLNAAGDLELVDAAEPIDVGRQYRVGDEVRAGYDMAPATVIGVSGPGLGYVVAKKKSTVRSHHAFTCVAPPR